PSARPHSGISPRRHGWCLRDHSAPARSRHKSKSRRLATIASAPAPGWPKHAPPQTMRHSPVETIVSRIPSTTSYRTAAPLADPPAAVIDLRGIVDVARRRASLIVFTGVLFLAAALFYLLVAPTRYMATVQLLLDTNGLQIVGADLTPRPGQGEVSLADV